MDVRQIKVLTLAYLGDARYELLVRKHLIDKGIAKPNQLQKEAIKYVSANSQSKFLHQMLDLNCFTEGEVDVIKRGRNAKSRPPKNVDVTTYNFSTALETLFGYHCYLENDERILEIFNKIIELSEE